MLSFEDYKEIARRVNESKKEREELLKKWRYEELREMGIDPDKQEHVKEKYDRPGTPDDGFVTILYVIVMVASLIFKDFWIIWICITIAYFKFITRHYDD